MQRIRTPRDTTAARRSAPFAFALATVLVALAGCGGTTPDKTTSGDTVPTHEAATAPTTARSDPTPEDTSDVPTTLTTEVTTTTIEDTRLASMLRPFVEPGAFKQVLAEVVESLDPNATPQTWGDVITQELGIDVCELFPLETVESVYPPGVSLGSVQHAYRAMSGSVACGYGSSDGKTLFASVSISPPDFYDALASQATDGAWRTSDMDESILILNTDFEPADPAYDAYFVSLGGIYLQITGCGGGNFIPIELDSATCQAATLGLVEAALRDLVGLTRTINLGTTPSNIGTIFPPPQTDTIFQQLQSAEVPSLCDNQRGRLVNGFLPDELLAAAPNAPIQPSVQLLDSPTGQADIDGDGRREIVATVLCGFPSEAYPQGYQSLVVYDDSLNLLGSVFIDGFPTSLTEDAQGLAVAWTTCVPDIDACIPDKNLNGHLRPTAGGFELVEDPAA